MTNKFWLIIPNLISVISESITDEGITECLADLIKKAEKSGIRLSYSLVRYKGGLTNIISDNRVIGSYYAKSE